MWKNLFKKTTPGKHSVPFFKGNCGWKLTFRGFQVDGSNFSHRNVATGTFYLDFCHFLSLSLHLFCYFQTFRLALLFCDSQISDSPFFGSDRLDWSFTPACATALVSTEVMCMDMCMSSFKVIQWEHQNLQQVITWYKGDTVDGWNPAPDDREFIPLFTRFYTSQVVQDFSHQQQGLKKWLQFFFVWFSNRNPYNGYINPYYWVDDLPLLYGNNGSLDPSTNGYFQIIFTLEIVCSNKALAKLFLGRDSLNLQRTSGDPSF